MYGTLSDLIYWLNCNILSFWDGITIPQIVFYTFSKDLSLFSFLNEWRQVKL